MRKRPKSKAKIITRVIVAILILVIAGAASYHGSKAIFTYKFRKDREAAEQKEQEEIASSIHKNYISVIRIGKLPLIRIFNTEASQLSFVLMRPDSDLFTYDEEGNAEEISKVVNNIENAYGITVDSYEEFDQSAFADFINNSDSFECNLPYDMEFKDTNKMTVHMKKGEHILNGGQAWGIVSGEGTYESQEQYMANVRAVLEGLLTEVFDDPTTESITETGNLIFDYCESDVRLEDVQNYFSLYAQLSAEDTLIVELEGEVKEAVFEVDIDKARDLLSDITSAEEGSPFAVAETTTEEETEDTTTEEDDTSTEE